MRFASTTKSISASKPSLLPKVSPKPTVFRRALALYMLAKQQEEAGASLQFAHGDQVETLVNI